MILGMRAGGGPRPVAKVNFLTTTSLPSWLTWTNPNGHRMMFDSTGKLTFAPANVLYYSSTPTNGSYWANLSLTSVTGNDTDGWLLLPNGTSTAEHGIYAYNYATPTATSIFSVQVKPSGYNYCVLKMDGANAAVGFDLTGSGSVGQSNGTISGGIEALSGGWFRVWTKAATPSNNAVRIYVATNSNVSVISLPATAFSGDGSSGLLIRRAQVEPVTYETSPRTYNATTSAAYYGPRFDYNPATLAARGLLIEESRTNLALRSQTFSDGTWVAVNSTKNATNINDPSGTETGLDVSYTGFNASFDAAPAVYQSINFTSGTVYTVSAWVRTVSGTGKARIGAYMGASTDSGDKDITTTWTRISHTFTATATAGGNISIRNDATGTTSRFYVAFFQLEVGSFPTSYIPTTTAAVTRNAETVSATGLAIPSTSCAGVLEFEAEAPGVQSDIFSFGTGAIANGYFMYGNATGAVVTQRAASSSVRTVTPTPGSGSPVFRYAFSRQGANLMLGVNNGTVVVDSSVVANPATPLTTVKILGTHNFYGTPTSGWARGVSVYYTGLSSAQTKTKSVIGGSY